MNQLPNRPAFLGQSANVIDALAGGLGSAQPPRISTSDDRFQPLDENGTPVGPPKLELDVVIVGANPHGVSRVYYEKPYDRDNPLAPDCYSDNGIGPSENSNKPQNATCNGCPMRAWTKPNPKNDGTYIPWCQERKKAAVLVIGGGTTVYLLNVPPTSHKKTLQPYIDSMRRQGADVSDVITTLGIKDKIWSFTAKGWLPNEKTYNFVKEIVKGDLPMNVVNAYDKPHQGALSMLTPMPQIEQQIAETVAESFIAPVVKEEPKPVAQPKAGPSAEMLDKLDSLFAKFPR